MANSNGKYLPKKMAFHPHQEENYSLEMNYKRAHNHGTFTCDVSMLLYEDTIL